MVYKETFTHTWPFDQETDYGLFVEINTLKGDNNSKHTECPSTSFLFSIRKEWLQVRTSVSAHKQANEYSAENTRFHEHLGEGGRQHEQQDLLLQ